MIDRQINYSQLPITRTFKGKLKNVRGIASWEQKTGNMVFNFLFVQCTSRVEKIQYTSKFLGRRNIKILQRGVSNGPIQFESARKILPLRELLAKIGWVLACSCSQNFCNCSHARIFVKVPLPCSVNHNLHLGWTLDIMFPVSKTGNHWGSMRELRQYFWKYSSPVYWRVLRLTGQSSVAE